MNKPINPRESHAKVSELLRCIDKANARDVERHKGTMREAVTFKGFFQLLRRFPNGKEEVVVDDKNMVVSMGRRVMSRLIAGNAGSPTIMRGQQLGLKVVRDNTDASTNAWYSFLPVDGTNGYSFALYVDDVLLDSLYVQGGTYVLSTLAAWINSHSKWHVVVLNSLDSIDAVYVVQTPRADVLGANVDHSLTAHLSNGYWRQQPVLATKTVTLASSNAGIRTLLLTHGDAAAPQGHIRFGTQGHNTDTTSIGKDVLASDEWLTSALRAADLGNVADGDMTDDGLTMSVTYPNTSIVTFTATLGTGQGNGDGVNPSYISEAGLFTSGNYLVARKNFGQVLKTSDFELVAAWSLVF